MEKRGCGKDARGRSEWGDGDERVVEYGRGGGRGGGGG